MKRRAAALAGACLAVLSVGAVIGWAANAVFNPPRDVTPSVPYSLVAVAEGSVGTSVSLNAVAEWEPTPVGANQASGVVTSISIESGTEVAAGAVIYSVDLRPVTVAQGDVPAFRSLAVGSQGQDVSQLQTMLAQAGFYGGQSDGDFGYFTEAAVKKWQKSVGTVPDGIVATGDVIWLPLLPVRVSLDTSVVAKGVTITPGTMVVSVLPNAPQFTIPVTDTQAIAMPSGTLVNIHGPDGSLWKTSISGQSDTGEDGQTSLLLQGAGDGPICGSTCGTIPVGGKTLFPCDVVTLEEVGGLSLPTSAILTLADGSLAVSDENGERHPVTIKASARGISIIEGVPAGLRVRAPGD